MLGLLAAFAGLFAGGGEDHPYREGQIWEYRTRPGEEGSRLYISRIEALATGEPAFHIHLDGLAMANPMVDGGMQTELPHAPVSRKTLDASVVALAGTTATPPDISDGYAAWREAHDAGQAGIFTISAAEIVGVIEEIIARQSSPSH